MDNEYSQHQTKTLPISNKQDFQTFRTQKSCAMKFKKKPQTTNSRYQTVIGVIPMFDCEILFYILALPCIVSSHGGVFRSGLGTLILSFFDILPVKYAHGRGGKT